MKKGIKVSFRGILVFLLAMQAVMAQEGFDTQKAYDWLAAQDTDGNFNNDIFVTSWAILAFAEANLFTEADQSLQWLLQQGSSCFPAENCKSKDTALAALALVAMDQTENLTGIETFYKDLLAPAVNVNHFLQVNGVSSPISGTCTLTYTVQDTTDFKDVVLVNGRFQSCGNSTFLNLDSCVKPNLLKANPGLGINVDCSEAEGGKIITYLAQAGNSYYLVASEERDIVDITVKNGCLGRGQGDPCNVDASLYSNWALRKLNSELDISLYLREAAEDSNPEHLALLYFATLDAALLSKLESLQSSDGSWNKDVYKTSLALLALQEDPVTYEREIDKARAYLTLKQSEDGSVQGNPLATAAALYAAFNQGVEEAEDIEPGCGDGSCDEGEDIFTCPEDCDEEEACDFNGVCDAELGENSETCSFDCPEEFVEDQPCEINGECEIAYDETAENCPEDCSCGDDLCDDSEDSGSCSEDCGGEVVEETECGNNLCEEGEEVSCAMDCGVVEEKGSGFGTFIFVILLLALLGGGAFFAYKKGLIKFKPKGPQEPQQPPYRPFSSKQSIIPPQMPQQPQRRQPVQQQKKQRPSADDELDRSIEEARKLLGK
ncbi:hypothetical protein HY501_00160 [Candidatus Woesearchaeota archaeon]|nr:hypothetical protein [Candidatus Woesearchaeota archaeon]